MIEHKKYMDIKVADIATIGGFEVGNHIVIQTKVDGANAAIRYDAETDTLIAQSRKQILSSDNNLRGFYEYVQLMDKNKVKAVLGTRYIAYMEWLVPHTIKYPAEAMNKAYCYDVYDTEEGKWMPQDFVKEVAGKLGITYVFTWYDGEFFSWEHCKSFLGGSVYGEEQQEGIVVKNETKLNDPNNRQPFYVKIVNEKFHEKMKNKEGKTLSPEEIAEYNNNFDKTKTIVTRARVEKILHKGIDEGQIPENWTAEDMKTIAKYVPREVVADCFKEEKEIVAEIDGFTKFANKATMEIMKEILQERQGSI